MSTPHGYRFGDHALATSPVTLEDLEKVKATLLWSPEDTAALRRAGEVLGPQTEDILDVWYGFVGSSPHLVTFFAGSDGAPSGDYLTAVRRRFALWITDTCRAEHDQHWLDWQHEIGVRHTAAGKNRTDGVDSTSREVSLRYLVAFVVPLTVTIRGFLAKGAAGEDDLEAMYNAWFKAVSLTATLWAQPYTASW